MSEQQHPFRGPETPSVGETDEDEVAAARAANRFDLRRIIGGVFLLYGVILIVAGIVGSHEVKTKADGININLWTGLAMLVVGDRDDRLGAAAAGRPRARGHARRGLGPHPPRAGDLGRRAPAPAHRAGRRATGSAPFRVAARSCRPKGLRWRAARIRASSAFGRADRPGHDLTSSGRTLPALVADDLPGRRRSGGSRG